MTDLKRFFSVLSLGSVIAGLSSVAWSAIFSRVVTPAEYGVYVLGTSAAMMLSHIALGWLDGAAKRYLPDTTVAPEVRRAQAARVAALVLAVAGTAALLGAAGALVAGTPATGVSYVMVTVAAAGAMGSLTLALGLHQSAMAAGGYVVLQSSNAVLRLAFALGLALLIANGAAGMLAGVAIGSFVSIVSDRALWRLRADRVPSQAWPDLDAWRRYGFPLVGWLLGSALLSMGDRWIIQAYMGSDDVGRYGAVYALVDRGIGLAAIPMLAGLHPVLIRRWTSSTPAHSSRQLSDLLSAALLIAATLVLWGAVLGPVLGRVLLDRQYWDALAIIPWVAAGVSLWFVGMIAHKPLELGNRSDLMLRLTGIAVALNIGANLLLVPRFGLAGAAWATMIAYGGYSALATWWCARNTQVRVSGARLLGNLSLPAGLLAGVTLSLALLKGVAGGATWTLSAALLAAAWTAWIARRVRRQVHQALAAAEPAPTPTELRSA